MLISLITCSSFQPIGFVDIFFSAGNRPFHYRAQCHAPNSEAHCHRHDCFSLQPHACCIFGWIFSTRWICVLSRVVRAFMELPCLSSGIRHHPDCYLWFDDTGVLRTVFQAGTPLQIQNYHIWGFYQGKALSGWMGFHNQPRCKAIRQSRHLSCT